jgi:GT2 family glycosyltransferase
MGAPWDAAATLTSPLLSVLTPVHDPSPRVLAECIESFRAQGPGPWELCLFDDGSTQADVRALLDGVDAANVRMQRSPTNGGIVAASNAALAMARGRYVALLDHDDLLAAGILARVADALEHDPDIAYLYTDEDHLTVDGASFLPVFKPDWSPERFRSHMYTNHLSVLRRSIVNEVGGFRSGFEGSQDYDLVLRVTERGASVRHLPVIGYHWRMGAGSAAANPAAKPYAFEAGRRAVQAHCDRMGIDATVQMLPLVGYHRLRRRLHGAPSVSVVIPSAGAIGRVWGLRRAFVVDAVRSLLDMATVKVSEVLVVLDAGADAAAVELASLGDDRVRVLGYDRPFDFAEKINLGAAQARGEVLLLLNDDVEVISPDFLETMLPFLEDPDVAMVGCKLLLADGRLQHAGHVYNGLPYHAFFGRAGDETGPHGLLLVDREVSGVTAACALVRADVFDEVGGFSPLFPRNYNDVDFSLKVRHAGYRIIYTPHASLYHFESQTRRPGVDPAEDAALFERWGSAIERDPYHNPNLVKGRDDWAIPYGVAP